MQQRKHLFSLRGLLALIAGLALLVTFSACSSYADNTPESTNSPVALNTSTPTPTSTPAVYVKTASAKVGGKTETILTNVQGLTLYYFTPDTSTQTACSGSCSDTWPPLLDKGASTVNGTSQIQSGLSLFTSDNGQQVLYNGHFLYTYAGDQQPGDTSGNGLGGKWFVATPDLAKL